jgi:hypothetical protein
LWGISKAAAETKAAEEAKAKAEKAAAFKRSSEEAEEEQQKVDYKNLPSAAKCPYWLRCREAFLELAHREGFLDGMKEYMVADAPCS